MLNRSKSLEFLLAFCASLFLAHELLAHFSSTSDLSKHFLTFGVPAPLGNSGTMYGVRVV